MRVHRLLSLSLLSISWVALSAPPSAQFPPIQSLDARNQLVELYTSEACKSCPPADTQISSFASHDKLWNPIIPVVFHVHIWDYLGWQDKLGSPYYTQRLKNYNSQWKLSGLKTPVLALNGQEWKNWTKDAVLPEIKKERAGILRLLPGPFQQVRVEFEPELREHDWVANVVVLGMGVRSEIKKGPNAGKTFDHNFVVLSHHSAPLKKKDKSFFKTLRLSVAPASPKSIALAAWVTRPKDLTVIQAVGGPLPLSFLQ